MIASLENPEDSPIKLLELVNEFSKFAGCKINLQISVAFLNTSNKLSEEEIEKAISLRIAKRDRSDFNSEGKRSVYWKLLH